MRFSRSALFGLLLAALFFVAPAQAIVTETLTVEISGGPYSGAVGVGSFSYDETALIVGDETLSPEIGDLAVSLDLLGQSFTESDDVDFGFGPPDESGLPAIGFFDFEPVFIDFLLSESGFNPIEIDAPGVNSIDIIGVLTPSPGGGFSAFATTIPEPSTLLISATAASLMAGRRARSGSQAK